MSTQNQSETIQKSSAEDHNNMNSPSFSYEKWIDKGVELRRLDAVDIVRLRAQHQKVIRDTWSLMQDHMASHGSRVFIRIFEVSSNIQKVFQMEDMTQAQMLACPRLIQHAMHFMGAIQFAVENLNDLDTLVAPVFINLGKHHIHFRGLKDDFFAIFTGAMMYVWRESLKEHFTADARAAWSRLLDFLIQQLQFGYHLALEDDSNK